MIVTKAIVTRATDTFFVEIKDDKLIIMPNNHMLPDKNTMVLELFGVFDRLPKDNYIGFREAKILQHLTNPELPLTVSIWKWICNILDSNPMIGIDINAFNSSYYYPARDIMGTDIARDWIRVNEKAKSGDWM